MEPYRTRSGKYTGEKKCPARFGLPSESKYNGASSASGDANPLSRFGSDCGIGYGQGRAEPREELRHHVYVEDTIVAPATAPGNGAVAIVRLSGPRAIAIL